MYLQYYGKITCNFLQKALAKNTNYYDQAVQLPALKEEYA